MTPPVIVVVIVLYVVVGFTVAWWMDDDDVGMVATQFWGWPIWAVVMVIVGIGCGPYLLIRWLKELTPTPPARKEGKR